MPDASGRLMLATEPSLQLAEPVAFVATTLTTQVLVLIAVAFGMGSGGPKKQPTLVQVLLLPVSADVVLPSVRAPVLVSQAVILVIDVSVSGVSAGSGTPSCPPP